MADGVAVPVAEFVGISVCLGVPNVVGEGVLDDVLVFDGVSVTDGVIVPLAGAVTDAVTDDVTL